jgi:hypothetical protein
MLSIPRSCGNIRYSDNYCLNYLELNYIIGILTTIVISYILLLKIQVNTRSDILDSLDILPTKVSNKIVKFMNKF